MTTLRGRAASAIRPGLIVKRILMGELPLDTGELVSEAAIVDLFNAYKRQLREYNQVREKAKHITGMHYRSFYTMFRFAQLLKLVEFVREEEADWKRKAATTAATSLIRLEKSAETGHIGRRISNRRVFRLSEVGKEDVKSWLDLTRAWKEQWPAPQMVEIPVIPIVPVAVEEVPAEVAVEAVPPPEVIPPKPKKGRKPRAEKVLGVAVPTLKLQPEPSKEQYSALLEHLRKLSTIGIDDKGVQREIDKLTARVGDWVVAVIEALEDATSIGYASKVIELRHLRNILTEVDEKLMDRDIPEAIEQLKKLV